MTGELDPAEEEILLDPASSDDEILALDLDGDGVVSADELAIHAEQSGRGLVGKVAGGKVPRPMAIIATLAVSGVTGGAVGALAWELVVNGSETASANLGQLAALGLGALVTVAGAGKNDRRDEG